MSHHLISFDVAALAVYAIVLFSMFVRDLRKDQTMRFFTVVVVLYTVTCLFDVAEGIFKIAASAVMARPDGMLGLSPEHQVWLSLLSLGYYATRLLAAPVYYLFIVNITNTAHTIAGDPVRRYLLSVPVLAALAYVLLNPWTHAIFTVGATGTTRAPGLGIVYVVALVYSVLGLAHLIRWRKVISRGQFIALATLFPLEGLAVILQFLMPQLHIEMFATAIAVLLVAMVVLVPEQLLDPLSGAQSYSSYADEVHTSLLTGMPHRLTYLQVMDYEIISRYLGRDRYHKLLRDVSGRVRDVSERRARTSLYYLRNGLFCVMEQPTDDESALGRARLYADAVREALESRGSGRESGVGAVTLETPADVSDEQTLRQLAGHLRRLLPQSDCVTSFQELNATRDFDLRMNLDRVMARAIETNGFTMWFQPIYCVRTNSFRSAEALIRLIDDEYGFVSPALFIPAAEETGQIIDIGNFVLEETARVFERAGLSSLGVDYVEINLSIEQCMEDDIVEKVTGAIDAHGLAPVKVNLELTETAASVSEEEIEHNIHTLAELGYTFSLDDFGTGYSNLARLMRLPFSIVKVDKSIVDGIGNPSNDAVITSVVEVMSAMGRHVLAEGVETKEQADRLIEMGVDYIQGFYYARPMPEADYVEFLKAAKQG